MNLARDAMSPSDNIGVSTSSKRLPRSSCSSCNVVSAKSEALEFSSDCSRFITFSFVTSSSITGMKELTGRLSLGRSYTTRTHMFVIITSYYFVHLLSLSVSHVFLITKNSLERNVFPNSSLRSSSSRLHLLITFISCDVSIHWSYVRQFCQNASWCFVLVLNPY